MKPWPTQVMRVYRGTEVLGHVVQRTDGRWAPITQRGDMAAAFEYPPSKISNLHLSHQWWPSETLAAWPLVLQTGVYTDTASLRFVVVARVVRGEVRRVTA